MASRNSKLLINEYPLMILPSLVMLVGIEKAVILQQIHFCITQPNSGKDIDGFHWVYNTSKEWQKNHFPFWTATTIERHLRSLEDIGLIVSRQFDRADWDRRKYYRIDYDNLDASLLSLSKGTSESPSKGTSELVSENPISDCKTRDCTDVENSPETTTETTRYIDPSFSSESNVNTVAKWADNNQPAQQNTAAADAPFDFVEENSESQRVAATLHNSTVKSLFPKGKGKEYLTAFTTTVESMGFMCSRANAKDVFKELNELGTSPKEIEESLKEVFKTWSRDKVVWVRFDSLPAMIRTCRERVKNGKMTQGAVKRVEEEGYETVDSRGYTVWVQGKRPQHANNIPARQ